MTTAPWMYHLSLWIPMKDHAFVAQQPRGVPVDKKEITTLSLANKHCFTWRQAIEGGGKVQGRIQGCPKSHGCWEERPVNQFRVCAWDWTRSSTLMESVSCRKVQFIKPQRMLSQGPVPRKSMQKCARLETASYRAEMWGAWKGHRSLERRTRQHFELSRYGGRFAASFRLLSKLPTRYLRRMCVHNGQHTTFSINA